MIGKVSNWQLLPVGIDYVITTQRDCGLQHLTLEKSSFHLPIIASLCCHWRSQMLPECASKMNWQLIVKRFALWTLVSFGLWALLTFLINWHAGALVEWGRLLSGYGMDLAVWGVESTCARMCVCVCRAVKALVWKWVRLSFHTGVHKDHIKCVC